MFAEARVGGNNAVASPACRQSLRAAEVSGREASDRVRSRFGSAGRRMRRPMPGHVRNRGPSPGDAARGRDVRMGRPNRMEGIAAFDGSGKEESMNSDARMDRMAAKLAALYRQWVLDGRPTRPSGRENRSGKES